MPAETPPDTGPRAPARARTAVRPDGAIAVLVFVAAVVASSWTWYGLALSAKFPPVLAAVPSISLDLGGIYFGRNWIAGRTPLLRTWGKITTIASVMISVMGNSVEHAIEAGLLPVTLFIVLAVGAVPAAVLFGVAHQWSLADSAAPRRDATLPRRAARAASGSGPAATQVGQSTAGRPAATSSSRAPASTVAHGAPVGKRATALAYARNHWPVTASEIIMGVRPMTITMTEACRVRDRVRDERAEATG